MPHAPFEQLDVYRLAEKLADEVWQIVQAWETFPRETVGRALVRAADRIGAHIATGAGEGGFPEHPRCVRRAQGALNEVKHSLRRAFRRRLLTEEQVHTLRALLDELSPRLDAYRDAARPRDPMDHGQPTTD